MTRKKKKLVQPGEMHLNIELKSRARFSTTIFSFIPFYMYLEGYKIQCGIITSVCEMANLSPIFALQFLLSNIYLIDFYYFFLAKLVYLKYI